VAPKKEGGSAVAKRAKNELQVVDLGVHADAGWDDIQPDELQIPWLVLLQDGSPSCKGSTKIKGHEPGMFLNTLTGEVFDSTKEDVIFIPARRERCFVEWIPVKQGGGFVGRHEVESDVVKEAKARCEFGQFTTPAGNELVESYYVYGVLLTESGASEVCFVFTSTKIKAWRNHFTLMAAVRVPQPDGTMRRPPLYAHRIKLGSCDDQNKAGQEFKNVTLEPNGEDIKSAMVIDEEDDVFQACANLLSLLDSGQASVDYNTQRSADGASAANDQSSDPVFDENDETM